MPLIGRSYPSRARIGRPPIPTAGGTTPPVFQTASTLTGAAAVNGAVPVPSGVVADDIVVVGYYLEPDLTITAPDGTWTQKASAITGASVTGLHVFWHRATGSESGTYTFTHASTFREAYALRISGCITTGDPFDGAADIQANAVAGTTTPAVQLTTSVDNTLLVWVASSDSGADAWAPPTNFTERHDTASGTTATATDLTAGATGSIVSGTISSRTHRIAFLGALKPVPTGTPDQTISPAGIVSGQYLGSVTETSIASPASIRSGELVGATALTQVISAAAIPTAVQVGLPRLAPINVSNGFEGGSNGSTITTTGSTGTAWDGVVIDGSNAATYTTADAIIGSVAGNFTAAAGSSQSLVRWITALDARPSGFFRAYYKIPTLLSTGGGIWINFVGSGPSLGERYLNLRANGSTLEVLNSSDVADATFSTALTAGQPFRVEWFVNAPGDSYEVRLFTGANLHGTTPTETQTGSMGYTRTDVAEAEFGIGWCGAATTVIADGIAYSTETWIGPAVSTQTITAAGIPSAERSGSHIATPGVATITTAGIASGERAGNITTTAVYTANAAGIASSEVIGQAAVAQAIAATGIPSAERHGVAAVTVSAVTTINATGIPSAEKVSTQDSPDLFSEGYGPFVITLSVVSQAIPSGAQVGNVQASIAGAPQTVTAAGIPSAQVAGTTLVGRVITSAGIQSVEVFGAASATPGTATVSPAGIPSNEALGTVIAAIAAAQTVNTTGIASEQRLGTAQIGQALSFAGIISAERSGNAVATPGAVTLSISGISSQQAFGTPFVSLGLTITAASIQTAQRFGDSALIPEGVPEAILASANLAGLVTAIRDNPSSPDAEFLTAVDPTSTTDLRVSFTTPFKQPNAVGGPRTFRAYVRRTANAGANPTIVVELWESGVFRRQLTSTSVTSTSGQLIEVAMDPADLTDATGAGVELRLVGAP